MIPSLLIHPKTSIRRDEAVKILTENKLPIGHPDLLILEEEEKLGIETVRKIREFLSLKPFAGKSHGLIIVAAENLTSDAQNALLKTLEEPVGQAVIILGAGSEEQFLPTIISRCHVVNLQKEALNYPSPKVEKWTKNMDKLLTASLEERFKFVEKLTEREEFLGFLTGFFRQKLMENPNQTNKQFMNQLLGAEKWSGKNVNIRAILEYLMLILPQEEDS